MREELRTSASPASLSFENKIDDLLLAVDLTSKVILLNAIFRMFKSQF